jgi:hypothetical protein
VLALTLGGASAGLAQNTSYEFWPELDLWYRLSPDWRLSALLPVTKYYESKYRDMNFYVQADYAFGTKRGVYLRLVDENRVAQMKVWLVRAGAMTGRSIGDNPGDYSENMLYGEIHFRAPLRRGFVFSSRVRLDNRWLGDDADYSYRYRYRAMLEREVARGIRSYVPYVSVEPFWDSRYDDVTRTRIIAGTTLSLNQRFAYELNLTYQHDKTYDTTNLYALNVILHVFFESKAMKARR